MKKTTGKIAVMGASFALFLCGAGALQLERGTSYFCIVPENSTVDFAS